MSEVKMLSQVYTIIVYGGGQRLYTRQLFTLPTVAEAYVRLFYPDNYKQKTYSIEKLEIFDYSIEDVEEMHKDTVRQVAINKLTEEERAALGLA